MNLLIIGSGAREHSFAWKIFNSKHDVNIFVTNANPGVTSFANTVNLDITNFLLIKECITLHSINIVLIGPEIPLIDGLFDFINNDPDRDHVKVIGPCQKGAMLEGSMEYAK